jgi:hypothetical protein
VKSNDDDMPVVVAGGSLYIIPPPHYYFGLDDDGQILTFSGSTRQLGEVEISYPGSDGLLTADLTFTASSAVSIKLGYCHPDDPNPCVYPDASDTITIGTAADGTALTITGSESGSWVKILHNLWKRKPHNGKLSWVRADDTTYDAGSSAECALLLHLVKPPSNKRRPPHKYQRD